MQRIPRDRAMVYEFDRRIPPAVRVQPGEAFAIETEDAESGRLGSADPLTYPESPPQAPGIPPRYNPVGGPVYVEGAEPGDLLAVRIERIAVGPLGWTRIHPGSGPLGDSVAWAEAATPGTHLLRHLPGPSGTLRDGRVMHNERFSWPLAPFIGTIGTAPEREVETTLVGQGPWGGNMDCRDVAEGSTALLNCYCPGGLLFVGDVHGSQADTEFTGTANETRAEVTLRCEVVKGKQIPFVRIVKPNAIVSVACGRPLEDVVHQAIVNLMAWMVDEYDVPPRDAYMLTAVCPGMRVNVYQMVKLGRIGFTAGAEFPLDLLGANRAARER